MKKSSVASALARDTRKLLRLPKRLANRARDRQLTKAYLDAHAVRKLQLGAGQTVLDGWLCTDKNLWAEGIIYLDATRPFPFDEATFDYVYSEHMIEHITWPQGQAMLRECRRVLKPGGTLRIATPDLEVLLGLYRGEGGEKGERYIQWITDIAIKDAPAAKASFVINNAFRNWGHTFLYDGELMTLAMTRAGFTAIRRFAVGQSDDGHLQNLESHGVHAENAEMVAFETMVYEATRAA